MGILTNSENPNEMLHNVAFHQGLHCLLRQNRSSEGKNTFKKKITSDSSKYTMDHPDLIVRSFMDNSFGPKRVYSSCKSTCTFRPKYRYSQNEERCRKI